LDDKDTGSFEINNLIAESESELLSEPDDDALNPDEEPLFAQCYYFGYNSKESDNLNEVLDFTS